eukprot:jgi/Mesvir1/1119/Mv17626-RA.1
MAACRSGCRSGRANPPAPIPPNVPVIRTVAAALRHIDKAKEKLERVMFGIDEEVRPHGPITPNEINRITDARRMMLGDQPGPVYMQVAWRRGGVTWEPMSRFTAECNAPIMRLLNNRAWRGTQQMANGWAPVDRAFLDDQWRFEIARQMRRRDPPQPQPQPAGINEHGRRPRDPANAGDEDNARGPRPRPPVEPAVEPHAADGDSDSEEEEEEEDVDTESEEEEESSEEEEGEVMP